MGIAIKDAQLVEQVTGSEKIAVSDGSGQPKTVTSGQLKEYIGTGYIKPSTGIPKTDLASDVQSSLRKADTALQKHQSLDNYATKEELAKKAEGSIYVLDNGNIKVTINGASKDFMPATPSGDPMHHYYESLGAQWNDGEDKTLQIPIYGKDKGTIEYMSVIHKSKRWYLNLLGNITNAQMAEIVSYPRNLSTENSYNGCKARTVIFEGNGVSSSVSYKNFCVRANIESLYVKQAIYPSDVTKMFYVASFFRYMLGDPSNNGYIIGYNGFGASNGASPALVEIRIYLLKGNALFPNSSDLSKTSVLFMVNEASPTKAITITLHPSAYARVANDEEVIAALEAKNAALQGTGGSVSIVSV
jgi:hypothetical protein